MKTNEIAIRDPYIIKKNGKYYLYGTRGGQAFGKRTGGFDVYVSSDRYEWDGPIEVFDSERYGLNRDANWAPEVHEYNGKFYMLATFTRENGLRGTFALVSDSLTGPFVPTSEKPLTPEDWECLDGTFYIDKNGEPNLVFCHEHTQITDGTVCYVRLEHDLSKSVGEVTTLFAASEPSWADKKSAGEHYVTDGPFVYRAKDGELYMIWSTFIGGKYAQCLVHFIGGDIGENFEHCEPIFTEDGGHGMLFEDEGRLYLVLHAPNVKPNERPVFIELKYNGRGFEKI